MRADFIRALIRYILILACAAAIGALLGFWLADAAPPTYHVEPDYD